MSASSKPNSVLRTLYNFWSAPERICRRQRSINGRWQYIMRSRFPSAFCRNYFMGSVGEGNCETLSNYVARQADRHPMVDDRIMAQRESLQFLDPAVRLDEERIGSHWQFIHSLQIGIVNADGWIEVRHEVVRGTRYMMVRASASMEWRLSRIGLLINHIHILLGCSMVESPESAALSLLNSLAYAQGITPALRFSYFAGTSAEIALMWAASAKSPSRSRVKVAD